MKKFILQILPFLIFINGCAKQQMLTELYPVWGEEIILTNAHNSNRYLQIKIPEQSHSVDACILIVHGMNEHIGRYEKIADYFSDRYIVAGIDLTAHGLSNSIFARAQNDLKKGTTQQDISDAFLEQAQLRSLQPMRDDLELALSYLIQRCAQQADNKKLPVFILSHSLGSLVSASWFLQTENSQLKNRISGIIFSGPAFSVTQVPGWRGWLQNPFIAFTYHTHEHFLHPHNEALPLLLFNQILSLVTVPIQDGMFELLSLPGLRQLFSPSTPDWVVNYLSDSEAERKRHQADPYIIRRSILRYVLTVEKEIIEFRRCRSYTAK
jgi:pimeloyl-ACP methyl ester carboxylesterase